MWWGGAQRAARESNQISILVGSDEPERKAQGQGPNDVGLAKLPVCEVESDQAPGIHP